MKTRDLIDKSKNVSLLSDMIEVSTREFTRRFSHYRQKAAGGESVRITSPDGAFVFAKEARGIRAGDFIEHIRSKHKHGLFDEGGAEAIEDSRTRTKPAVSPWD